MIVYLYIALGILVVHISWTIIYNVFFHPLRNIQGTFLMKLTDYWLLLIELAGWRAVTVHHLHQKYGSVIRIAPNELVFSSAKAAQQIYGQTSDFIKAPLYKEFGRHALFTMQDNDEHKERRKLLAPAFSTSSFLDSEPLIHNSVRELLEIIKDRDGKPLDVFFWFKMLSLDIAGDLLLGKAFGALKDETTPGYVYDFDTTFIVSGIRASLPLIYQVLSRIPFRGLQKFLNAENRIYEYGFKAYDAYLDRHGRQSQRKDLLTKIMRVNPDSKEAGGLSDYEVGVEVSNSIIAATNATGITLTYIFWELACHPEWQDKLREEFKGVETDGVGGEGAVWYKDIATLPVLNAVVNEVMRKIPAFPASLPRMPSAGGAVIDGVFVPANVIVSAQCYTLHRHSVTFPSPDSFSPDRWLDTHNGTDTMRDLFVPFSRGLRNCMGQNLALMELKIVTAAVLKRYTVSVGKAMRGDEMEMRDHFVLMPKAGRCELVFESVRKT